MSGCHYVMLASQVCCRDVVMVGGRRTILEAGNSQKFEKFYILFKRGRALV